MKIFHRRNLTALAAALLCSAVAQAEISNESKTLVLSGFGTLSAVQTDNANIQFRSDNRLPTGATNSHEFDNDSKLGVQLSYRPTDKLQAVVQLLSRRNEENSYNPSIDWAYLAYKPMSALTVRAGRFVAPVLMGSDYRNVGYANIWVRPPTDVYNSATINNVDGLDAIYRGELGPFSYSAQAYFGTYDLKFPNGAGIKFNRMGGLNLTAELGSWTFRASHMDARHTNYQADGLVAPSTLFAVSEPSTGRGYRLNPAGASCNAGLGRNVGCSALFTNFDDVFGAMRRDHKPFNITDLGLAYDNGKMVMQAEYMMRKTDSLLSDGNAYYVTAGYRFGKLLPYVTYSGNKTDTRRLTLTPSAAIASVFTNGEPYVQSSNSDSNTLSLGLRVDVTASVALKFQLDRYTANTNSFGATDAQTMSRLNNGVLATPMSTSVGSVKLATVALDFVF
jgi:hypothetical protein